LIDHYIKKMTFSFESSLMKYYRIYSLNSERDVLNYLAFYVNQDNSTYITFHSEFPLVLVAMSRSHKLIILA